MSSSKDANLEINIIPGSRIHVAFKKQSSSTAPVPYEEDALRIINEWLRNSMTNEDTFTIPDGYIRIGRILDQSRLRSKQKGTIIVKGCPFKYYLLTPQDAAQFDQVNGIEADNHCSFSDMEINELSSDSEFATTPESSPVSSPSKSSRTTHQKEARKASKKRAKARKRLLSQTSSSASQDGGVLTPPDTRDPASLSPRSALDESQVPAKTTSVPTPLRLELSQPIPSPLPSPVPETTTANKTRKAKFVKWSHIDFSKVNVEVPAISARTTLIVRPVDPANQLRKLHPLKLSALLNNTFGEVLEVRDIRYGGLAVDINPSTAKLEDALATTNLLGTKVTVATPLGSKDSSSCYAVATGIHPELSESELLELIVSSAPITAVKRLAKNLIF